MSDFNNSSSDQTVIKTVYVIDPNVDYSYRFLDWVRRTLNLLRVAACIDIILMVIFLAFCLLDFIPMFSLRYPGFWIICIHIPTSFGCILTSFCGEESISLVNGEVLEVMDQKKYYQKAALYNGISWIVTTILSIICTGLDIFSLYWLIKITYSCVISKTSPPECRDVEIYVLLHTLIVILYVLVVDLLYLIAHAKLYIHYGKNMFSAIKYEYSIKKRK